MQARGIAVDFVHDGRRQRVLQDINIAVPKGSLVSLIGPSGCGKSTLLKVMAGLVLPTEGTHFASTAWRRGSRPRSASIGLVFQDATLLPWKNAIENAAFLADDGGRDHIEVGCIRPAPRTMLKLVGLDGAETQDAVAACRAACASASRLRARSRSIRRCC